MPPLVAPVHEDAHLSEVHPSGHRVVPHRAPHAEQLAHPSFAELLWGVTQLPPDAYGQ